MLLRRVGVGIPIVVMVASMALVPTLPAGASKPGLCSLTRLKRRSN